MKRLLDRMLARWYVPVEQSKEAVQRSIQDQRIVVETLAEARRILRAAGYAVPEQEYVQLAQGVYWPVPETQSVVTRSRCS